MYFVTFLFSQIGWAVASAVAAPRNLEGRREEPSILISRSQEVSRGVLNRHGQSGYRFDGPIKWHVC
jgi:hypothetical protein